MERVSADLFSGTEPEDIGFKLGPEVARRLGERWRNAAEADKAHFQKSFSEEYRQYRKLLDSYKKKNRGNFPQLSSRKRKSDIDASRERGRKKRPYRTDPSKPKPPHNAFMLFCNKFRQEVKKEVLMEQQLKVTNGTTPVAPPKEVARRLGKRWREAKPGEKLEFLKCFNEKYTVYKNALLVYSQSH